MKVLSLSVSILTLAFLLSCGGSEQKADSGRDKAEAPVKKLSIRTQEGMMQRLKELNIQVPEMLTFKEIKEKGTEVSVVFVKDKLSDTEKTELQNWHTHLVDQLLKEGWKPLVEGSSGIGKSNMMGISDVWTTHLTKKKEGSFSTLGLTITSIFGISDNSYELQIKPGKF